MQLDSSKIQEIIKLIGYILISVIAFFILIRVDNYLRYKAIDECGKVSKYETTDKNARVSYPVIDIYEKCLKDKGIK